MTKIYFIRHGQTFGNSNHIFNGQDNMELTDTGYKQAELVGEGLKDVNIDAVYSSDLARAKDTAVPLARNNAIEINCTKELREIYAGEWQGISYEEIAELYPDEWGVWLNDIGNCKCAGGETVCELGERVFKTVKEIADENPGKTVAIVSHATPIRAFMTLVLHGSLKNMKDVEWVPNASITEITYENGEFRIIEAGSTKHLKGLVTKLPDNC